MFKKVYITTPIYYASGKPHIGHCFSTILADVYAEYNRLLNKECFMLTGMDEHGQKIADKASANNMSPKDFVDSICKEFTNLWSLLNINYQGFIRTTNPNHEKAIQIVFEELLKHDNAYLSQWKGLYCVQCEENYTKAAAVEKDGKLYCSVGHELVYKTEESYFLKLSKYQKWLEQYYVDHKDFISPQMRLNEINTNFIKPGVEDLSITRTTFDWGVKTLTNPQHIIYVWIDALMSYVTGLGYLSNDETNYLKFWKDEECEVVHVIGKEITRFHGIYWPILLHCLNLRQPSRIVSHGWIITKEGKMSKSLGNVIDPIEYINNYGSDALRYYLLKAITIDHDGIFNKDLFIETFNSDLANNYGNFISRTIGMINKYANGCVPNFELSLTSSEQEIIKKISSIINSLELLIHDFNFQAIINHVMDLLNLGNKYIEETKPWNLIKENKNQEVNKFLNVVFLISLISTYLLSPILKNGTAKAFNQLNIDIKSLNINNLIDINKYKCHKIGTSKPIYMRIVNNK